MRDAGQFNKRVKGCVRTLQAPLEDIAKASGSPVLLAALAITLGASLRTCMRSGWLSPQSARLLIERAASIAFDNETPPAKAAPISRAA